MGSFSFETNFFPHENGSQIELADLREKQNRLTN
jgi:hypothetical protein